MKKFLLSFVNLILSAVMLVALICPLSSFQNKVKDSEEDNALFAQQVTMLDFVESLFANDDKIVDAEKDYAAKCIEITQELMEDESITIDEFDEELETRCLCSKECAKLDVFNFATQEDLLDYEIADGNLITQTKVVGGLSIAFLACAALVIVVNVLALLISSPKLRGLASFLTFIACLLSIALVVVIEVAFSVTGIVYTLYAKALWGAYIIIAYTAIYFLIRLMINAKLKKM